jgi:methylmalonyl-CoA mutase N-terminal domain/subunit
VVVGVNRFGTPETATISLLQIDPEGEARQAAAVRQTRATRDPGAWRAALDSVACAAACSDNPVPPIIAAVEARATLGEISDTLRRVFGEHRELAV